MIEDLVRRKVGAPESVSISESFSFSPLTSIADEMRELSKTSKKREIFLEQIRKIFQ